MWRLYGEWSENVPAETSAVAITLDSQDLANCFNQYHGDKCAMACSISYKRPENEAVKHQSISGSQVGKVASHPDSQLMMSMLFLTQNIFLALLGCAFFRRCFDG